MSEARSSGSDPSTHDSYADSSNGRRARLVHFAEGVDVRSVADGAAHPAPVRGVVEEDDELQVEFVLDGEDAPEEVGVLHDDARRLGVREEVLHLSLGRGGVDGGDDAAGREEGEVALRPLHPGVREHPDARPVPDAEFPEAGGEVPDDSAHLAVRQRREVAVGRRGNDARAHERAVVDAALVPLSGFAGVPGRAVLEHPRQRPVADDLVLEGRFGVPPVHTTVYSFTI